jgi:hypothetical protein
MDQAPSEVAVRDGFGAASPFDWLPREHRAPAPLPALLLGAHSVPRLPRDHEGQMRGRTAVHRSPRHPEFVRPTKSSNPATQVGPTRLSRAA